MADCILVLDPDVGRLDHGECLMILRRRDDDNGLRRKIEPADALLNRSSDLRLDRDCSFSSRFLDLVLDLDLDLVPDLVLEIDIRFERRENGEREILGVNVLV